MSISSWSKAGDSLASESLMPKLTCEAPEAESGAAKIALSPADAESEASILRMVSDLKAAEANTNAKPDAAVRANAARRAYALRMALAGDLDRRLERQGAPADDAALEALAAQAKATFGDDVAGLVNLWLHERRIESRLRQIKAGALVMTADHLRQLSSIETRLAKQDPLGLAVLLAAGVRVDAEDLALSQDQAAMVEALPLQAGMLQLVSEDPGPRTHSLLAAATSIRLRLAEDETKALMTGSRPDPFRAAAALERHMSASGNLLERNLIWLSVGLAYFNEDWAERELTRLVSPASVSHPSALPKDSNLDTTLFADKVGHFVFLMSKAGPPELATMLLDRVMERFDGGWMASEASAAASVRANQRPDPFADPSGYVFEAEQTEPDCHVYKGQPADGVSFFAGLSRAAAATAREPEISAWLIERGTPQAEMIRTLQGQGSGNFTAVALAIEQAGSARLAKAMHDRLQSGGPIASLGGGVPFGAWDDDRLKSFSMAMDAGTSQVKRREAEKTAKAQFENLKPADVTRYFNDLADSPVFAGVHQLDLVAEDKKVEARNALGTILNLQADNEEVQKAGNRQVDWYHDNVKRRIIARLESYLAETGGDTPRFRILPALYADKTIGLQPIMLLAVDNMDGSGQTLVDSSVVEASVLQPDLDPPWKYEIGPNDPLEAFQLDCMLSPDGRLFAPKSRFLDARPPDGHVAFHEMTPATDRIWESRLDTLATGTGVTSGLILLGGALAGPKGLAVAGAMSVAAPAAAASTLYGGVRSLQEFDRLGRRGQSQNPAESLQARLALLGVMSTALGVGSTIAGVAGRQLAQKGTKIGLEAADLNQVLALNTGRRTLERGYRLALASQGANVGDMGIGAYQSWAEAPAVFSGDASTVDQLFFAMGIANMGIGTHFARREHGELLGMLADRKTLADKVSIPRAKGGVLAKRPDTFPPTAGLAPPPPQVEIPKNPPPHLEDVLDAATLSPPDDVPVAYSKADQDGESTPTPLPARSSFPPIDPDGFPNPAGPPKLDFWERLVNNQHLRRPFRRTPAYHAGTYERLHRLAPVALAGALIKPGTFEVDDNTVQLASIPGGLEHVANDIHAHLMGYDRRAGRTLGHLLDVASSTSRILFGSIPQFCGGHSHYLNVNPTVVEMQAARELDLRVASDFLSLYKENPKAAARADISLTGLEFWDTSSQDPVAYATEMMLDHPGVFKFVGEVTGIKEAVTVGLGPQSWNILSAKFQSYLRFANETGQGVLLHYDWGSPTTDPHSGRIAAAKTDYDLFDGLVKVLGNRDYRNANIVLAHTGIGRYVRPDDTLITKQVTVRELDGQVVETKEVSAPLHIHKLYELFDKVPNARADISWNDVTQAYVDSPELREALITFVIDHRTRLLFGSDTVKPVNAGHYNQALTTALPIFADIAERPNGAKALWRLLRYNYEDMMAATEERVAEWTTRELLRQGRQPAADAMARMNSELEIHRHQMATLARRQFEDWLANLAGTRADVALALLGNPGEFPLSYERLQRVQSIGYGAPGQVRPFPFRDNLSRIGRGTSGGHNNESRPRQAAAAAMTAGMTGATAAGIPALPMSGNPGMVNDVAFEARSLLTLLRAFFVEKNRLRYEAIFEQARVTRNSLNRFMDDLFRIAPYLGVTDEQLLKVSALTEQFWVNYRYLRDKELDPSLGYDKVQRFNAMMGKVGEYEIALTRVLGFQTVTGHELDARAPLGQALRIGTLSTYIVNNWAFMSWLSSRGLSFDTPQDTLNSTVNLAFGIGNGLFTLQNIIGLSGGIAKLSSLELHKATRLVNFVAMSSTAVGGAAWAGQDLTNVASAVSHAMSQGFTSVGDLARLFAQSAMATAEVPFALAAAKLAQNDWNAITGRPMPGPLALQKPLIILCVALALREALSIGLRLTAEEKEAAEELLPQLEALEASVQPAAELPDAPAETVNADGTDGSAVRLDASSPDQPD